MIKNTLAFTVIIVLWVIALSSFKNSEHQKERYFFVGFDCTGGLSGGNGMTVYDGKFISYLTAKNQLRSSRKLVGEIAITSISEFKNKIDYDQFWAGYKGK